jgi:hypothetical protein
MDAGAVHFVPSGEGDMVTFQVQRGGQSAHDELDEGTGVWVRCDRHLEVEVSKPAGDASGRVLLLS